MYENRKEKNKKNKKKVNKYKITLIIAIAIIAIIYFIALISFTHDLDYKEVAFIGLIVFIITMIAVWIYKNNIETMRAMIVNDIQQEVADSNMYDVTDHIKLNGNAYDGEVVHIKEYSIFDEILDRDVIIRSMVIKFTENGTEKYIVRKNCPINVKLLNKDRDDIFEVYDESDRRLEKYKENCINIYQYYKDGYTSLRNLTGDMTLVHYADSIEKNFEGEIYCKVYEYNERYSFGEISGNWIEEPKEENQIKNDEFISKLKEVSVYVIIIIVLIFIMGLS